MTTKIEARIAARLVELDDDREDREQARQVIARVDARTEDVRDQLVLARKRLKRRRDALASVMTELEQHDATSPDADTPEEIALRARRDQLAGELDEAVAIRDRILDKLDRLQEKRNDAQVALQKAIEESVEDRDALKRMRARRQRIKEARARNDRPSPNFDWAEFDCNDGTPLPEAAKPAVKDWCLRVGEPLRAKFGSVHINSAFRHRAYNASIGGEDASIHIYDYPGRSFKAVAVDVRCANGTPTDWYNFTAGKAAGRGRYNTFHHADSRDRIGWPPAVWAA